MAAKLHGHSMSEGEAFLHELELVMDTLQNQAGTLDRLRAQVRERSGHSVESLCLMLTFAVDDISDAHHRITQAIQFRKAMHDMTNKGE